MRPEANVVRVPSGANLKILPVATFATNRLPVASKASPLGAFLPKVATLTDARAVKSPAMASATNNLLVRVFKLMVKLISMLDIGLTLRLGFRHQPLRFFSVQVSRH